MKSLRLPLGLILAFSFGMQSRAFAQDYYVPIKKELEPMARLPLSSYIMDDKKISYILPRDIVGRPLQVEAAFQDRGDNVVPRIFKGPLATIACMGDNILPACVVTHTNLNINPGEVSEHLTRKYKDPKKLGDAIAVAEQFRNGPPKLLESTPGLNETSSSSDPIGVISKRSLPSPKAIPRVWKVNLTRFTEGNSVVNGMEAKFDLIANNFAEMVTNGRYAVAKDVFEDAGHWSGVLEFVDGERRWFDMNVSSDKTVLTGTWGFFNQQGQPLQAQGAFKGKEF